jgi:predicted PurR-regulated permease PerM
MVSLPSSPAARIGLTVLLLLAGVIALHLAESVILPLLVAMLLATVLWPAAHWLRETLKIKWGIACIMVVIGLALTSVLITLILSASVARLVTQLSDEREVLKVFKNFRGKLQDVCPGPLDEGLFPKEPAGIRDIGAFRYVSDAAPYVLKEVGKYASSWTWQLGVTFFMTFFVLMEGRMLASRAVAIVGPSEEVQTKAAAVLAEMANQVRTYLVWRTIINIGLAFVLWIVYTLFGLNQALTWAVILAILNYIPYLGPILACIPPFLDAFIFRSPAAGVVVLILYWIIVILEGHLVVPLLMGRNMNLNATTVMMSCLFWELVWGMTGMFLAMPIMAGIKAILYTVPEWRPWAILMSTEDEPAPGVPPPPPPDPGVPAALPAPGDSPNGKAGHPHVENPAEHEIASS